MSELFRRFILIDVKNEEALEQLVCAKGLTHDDLILILETITLNPAIFPCTEVQ